MAVQWKSKFFALTIVELLMAIIDAGLIAAIEISSGVYNIAKMQTVDATVFGYVIIQTLALIGYFTKPMHIILRLIISVLGAVLWITSGSLILEAAVNTDMNESDYNRCIAAGILGLFQILLYGLDTFFIIKKMRSED